jgi:hypothetical protein
MTPALSITQHGNGHPSFQDTFAPIAHHLFPDGCPDEMLAEVWPVRTKRAAVPFQQAKVALLQTLRRWAVRYGLEGRQLDAVALAATHVVSGQCSSLLQLHLKAFLHCLIPRQRECFLDVPSLRRLLQVRLDDDDRGHLYRLFILAIRNRVLIQRPDKLFSSYYPLIFHHCQRLDEAVQLVHLITKRQHVCPFRAKRLLSWHRTARRPSLYILLKLYSKFDPQGCQTYVPEGGTSISDQQRKSAAFRKDTRWERDLLAPFTKKGNREPSSKRAKTTNTATMALDGIATWRGQREASKALVNEVLLAHVSIADDDDAIVQVRANLPYMLYEEWYVQIEDHTGEKERQEMESDGDQNEEIEVVRRQATASIAQTRSEVVTALALFSRHLNRLLPEIETFVLEDVLPAWDGTDSFGLVLCQDLLPYLDPMNERDLHSRLLLYLEPLIRFGSPRLQYRILGCMIPQLIRRWERRSAILSLVKWASKETKRALLGNSAHELVLLSLVEIYEAVRVTTNLLPKKDVVCVLFLSRTAVSMNQLCLLLMKYRAAIVKSQIMSPNDLTVKSRVDFFNPYVLNICRALWSDSIGYSSDSTFFSLVLPDGFISAITNQQKALSLTHAASFQGCPSFNKCEWVDQFFARGLIGLHSFLVTFVGALADREQRRKSAKRTNLDREMGEDIV